MFLKTPKASTDPRIRSLLQKAVRRGFAEVVERTMAHLVQNGDKRWLRSRTVVIAFEECWPLAGSLLPGDNYLNGRNPLLRISAAAKQKDGAALGALGYAFHEGDDSMLDCVPDPATLKIIAQGLDRPVPFFEWIWEQNKRDTDNRIVLAAQKYLSAATWPWDKACIMAGALLSANQDIPEIEYVQEPKQDFPFWIALDKHTPEGKAMLNMAASHLNWSYRQLIWASFYCESAKVNGLVQSSWWEAEKIWRLRRVGLTIDSAEELWSRARGMIRDGLAEESISLQMTLEDVSPLALSSQGELF